MTHTPQQYLEDIRTFIWAHNVQISPQQRAALKSVPIIYKALPQNRYFTLKYLEALLLSKVTGIPERNIRGGYFLGVTEKANSFLGQPGAKEIDVFGCDHMRDQEEMAKTLVHELGHVLSTNGGHDEEWAACVQMLGLNAEAYYGNQKSNGIDEHLSGAWIDTELAAFVHSLPPVEWGDVDHDAEVCFRNALACMKGW